MGTIPPPHENPFIEASRGNKLSGRFYLLVLFIILNTNQITKPRMIRPINQPYPFPMPQPLFIPFILINSLNSMYNLFVSTF